MITIHSIPAFSDNYIWLIVEGKSAIAVDPGDGQPVLAYLKENQLNLTTILITHHHADHQGGINKLLEHNSQLQIFGPANETITAITNPLSGQETLFGHLHIPIHVLSTPGHTRGHLSYQIGYSVFTGDTLFGGGCGRLFEGSAEQMLHSLEKLATLPDHTLVYCGHEYTLSNLLFAQMVEPGNKAIDERIIFVNQLLESGKASVPSSIAEEKLTNPFLRCGLDSIKSRVMQHFGYDELSTPLAVFTALREWKNVF